jgi:hypothetical protein
VKILPMTPDDPGPELEERLATLRALDPMEFEPGERELAARRLAEQDRLSRAAMQGIARSAPCRCSETSCRAWPMGRRGTSSTTQSLPMSNQSCAEEEIYEGRRSHGPKSADRRAGP